jgi:hypothetical protein
MLEAMRSNAAVVGDASLHSYPHQHSRLDQPIETCLYLSRHVPAAEQDAQLHVHGEGVLGQVGARQERPRAVSDGGLRVQDTVPATRVGDPVLGRPEEDRASAGDLVAERAQGVDVGSSMRSGVSSTMRTPTPRAAAATIAAAIRGTLWA